jgi:hypothetical protein
MNNTNALAGAIQRTSNGDKNVLPIEEDKTEHNTCSKNEVNSIEKVLMQTVKEKEKGNNTPVDGLVLNQDTNCDTKTPKKGADVIIDACDTYHKRPFPVTEGDPEDNGQLKLRKGNPLDGDLTASDATTSPIQVNNSVQKVATVSPATYIRRNPYIAKKPMKHPHWFYSDLDGKQPCSPVVSVDEEIKCTKCKQSWKTTEMQKFYRCPSRKCGQFVLDFFRDDLMQHPLFGVPTASEKQKSGFCHAKIQLQEAMSMLKANACTMSPEVISKLWHIKDTALRAELLVDDAYKARITTHHGINDALSNLCIAIEREDKVGFRSAYYMLMYMVMVGYSHIDWNKARVMKSENK